MSLDLKKGGSGLDKREWDALIGIITAIIGNALISLALNIQRYAHIRLSRDRKKKRTNGAKWRRKKDPSGLANYGSQIEVAEERARMNRKAPHMDENDFSHREAYHQGHLDEDDFQSEADERTPLKGPSSMRSSASDSTRSDRRDDSDDDKKQSYLSSPYWWLGITLMTVGEAGNFIAYGFAPASIVSPLGVVALISNCIIAPLLLKERFRQRDFWGVLIAIGGAVTVVLSARMKDPKLGPGDIWVAITRWEFELYLGLTAVAILALMWVSSRYGHKSVFIDLGLVGLFGGYTALATKGVASLLTDTIWRAVTFPIFYLLVAVLVITAIFQIRYVNKALQRFDSTRVVPTQFVCFTISVISGSAILYREFESATKENVGKFVGGCVMTFLGVWLITSGKRENEEEENFDPESGESEGIRLIDEESEDNDITDPNGKPAATPTLEISVAPVATAEDAQSPAEGITNGGSFRLSQKPPAGIRGPSIARGSGDRVSRGPDRSVVGSNGDHTIMASTSASKSEPLLPSEARLNQLSVSSSSKTPTKPNLLTPRAPDAEVQSRKSVSRMFPAPISAPLSSSLSAIVADQLRRGVDVTRSSRDSKRSSLRRMRSNILDAEEPDAMQTNSLFSSSQAGQQSRTRSVSGTFADFFKRDQRATIGSSSREPSQDPAATLAEATNT